MSRSQNVASITVPQIGANGVASPSLVFPFSIARTSSGAVFSRTQTELEELTTAGVDGRRWRQVRTFFPSFTMETYADYTSYTLAVADCQGYWLAQGQFVTLAWSAAGTTSANYYQVKVIDVQAVVSAGVMNGFGAETGSSAIIRAVWTLAVQAVENTQPA